MDKFEQHLKNYLNGMSNDDNNRAVAIIWPDGSGVILKRMPNYRELWSDLIEQQFDSVKELSEFISE